MTTCGEREPNCDLEQTPERQDGQQPMRPRRASAVRAVASGQEHAERNGTGDDDEKNVYRTNPNSKDTDHDGRDDGTEVKNKTNPRIPLL